MVHRREEANCRFRTLLLAKETMWNTMRYQQLTEGQRYQIACLRDHGLSQAMVAKELGVHPSTISRELRRNRSAQGYQPLQAHQSAIQRRSSGNKYRVLV